MKRIYAVVLTAALVLGMAGAARAERLVIEGSTTVLPIAQRAAEEFMDSHKGADISVRGGGSGVGITSLLEGTCDIANSSRPFKDAELEKAVNKGKEPKANVVAMDGIAVVVNAANTVTALSKQQLKDIYTGKTSDWSTLGGPAEKIVVVSRDSASGTFEAFGELALDKQKVRKDALMEASNQAVASVVAKTPGAIGYVGLAYVRTGVKALEIDGVAPTKSTVVSKQYRLSRPLFMYTNGKPQGLAKEFIDFILSPQGQKLVDEEGFVSIK
jgi:phosphate transport system substrate-binding protein